MVDKLVALPTSIVERIVERRNPRFRDIWDLYESLPLQARERRSIIQDARSLAARRTSAMRYDEVLATAAARLPAVIESQAFDATMRRFLPSDVAEQSIGDPDYRSAMTNALAELFAQARDPGFYADGGVGGFH